MVLYYPLIVEAIIEFLRYSREFIAGVRNREYKESPSAHRIPLVEGYTVEYLERHDKYYCLKQSQDFSDRLKILDQH